MFRRSYTRITVLLINNIFYTMVLHGVIEDFGEEFFTFILNHKIRIEIQIQNVKEG